MVCLAPLIPAGYVTAKALEDLWKIGKAFQSPPKKDSSLVKETQEIKNLLGPLTKKHNIPNIKVLVEKKGPMSVLSLPIPCLPPIIRITAGFFPLDPDGLLFITKHEISHIKNNDKAATFLIETSTGTIIAYIAKCIITFILYKTKTYSHYLSNSIICISVSVLVLITHKITTLVATKFTYWREQCADDFACVHSTEKEKLGGLRFLYARIKLYKYLLSSHPLQFGKKYSLDGEDLKDHFHPLQKDRIQRIKDSMQKAPNLTNEKEKIDKIMKFLLNNSSIYNK